MNRGAALIGALLATLTTPATWSLALAAFLIRGGILLVLLPIVVLPTPVGLGNVFAPTLTSIAFGSVSTELLVVAVAVVAGTVAWLVLGGWLAAVLEAEGARIVALDQGVRALDARAQDVTSASSPSSASRRAQDGRRVAARILAARLLAFIPLALVLAWGSVRIVLVTYQELTSPFDVATPIVLRVLRASPEVVAAVVLAWMIGEIVGAIAARRIVMGGVGVAAALRAALVTCLRHPLSTLARFWLPTIVLLAVLVPCAVAAAAAWSAVDAVLGGRPDAPTVFAVVALFVVLWVVGLVLTAVVCAWRAAVWTVAEVTREGTFGGSPNRRPGDWRADPSSATL